MASHVIEVIKTHDGTPEGEPHWTDDPPEMWMEDETKIWTMLFEVEDKLKQSIIEIVERKQ